MGIQSFTYSAFMEYWEIMLYTQDAMVKKKRERETNVVPVPMYMLVGEIDSKEMRRQIYKIVASFSECYERNGKLC